MKTALRALVVPIGIIVLATVGHAIVGVPSAGQEKDPQTEAAGWISKADSVQALVQTVLAGAIEKGAEEHPVAKDNVVDARRWMAEGEKALKAAKEAMAAEDYEKANRQGNMAWQYYVKAGSAAVRADRLAGGGG